MQQTSRVCNPKGCAAFVGMQPWGVCSLRGCVSSKRIHFLSVHTSYKGIRLLEVYTFYVYIPFERVYHLRVYAFKGYTLHECIYVSRM